MEKFKSHRQLQDRCRELIENNEKVCQTIIDMANVMELLVNFNILYDYIYQEEDETEETFGMWKVGRGERPVEPEEEVKPNVEI